MAVIMRYGFSFLNLYGVLAACQIYHRRLSQVYTTPIYMFLRIITLHSIKKILDLMMCVAEAFKQVINMSLPHTLPFLSTSL
jgi:hypothetical protein